MPYLAHLGVSHLYASPMLRARPGSTHGYDVVDPTALNPELGAEEDRQALVAALRSHGMGLVLDIVPNHMAAAATNPFWDDVLTHGPSSPFARWFDIDWTAPGPARTGQVVLAVLGHHRGRALDRGELALVRIGGEFRVRYFDQSFPVDPATLPRVLTGALAAARARLTDHPAARELAAVLTSLRGLPPRTTADPEAQAERRRAAAAAVGRLAAICEGPLGELVDAAVAETNDPADRGRLRGLLDAQVYRLVHWRRASEEINYRRFFNISELIGVRVEDPEVFEATHAAVLRWTGDGEVHGLRVDHVDGLLDPRGYLDRLHAAAARAASADGVPVFVEKILSGDEALRPGWPVAGTTGYEFLNALERIFIDPEGTAELESWYRRMIVRRSGAHTFAAVLLHAKRRVLEESLAADVRRLGWRLWRLVRRDPRAAALTTGALTEAIVQAMVCLPVYRTYVDGRPPELDDTDRRLITAALACARERHRAREPALDLLEEALLGAGDPGDGPRAAERLAFVQRFQQTSGPVMAKGLEDTALYVWVPLVSRNEVGGDPDVPVRGAVPRFHLANRERAARWPRAMLCTTTHDTKRTADVRSRLDVLSELPDLWITHVARWRRENRVHRRRVSGRLAPDATTEYLFYQTLVGVWPLAERGRPGGAPDHDTIAALRTRVQAYMQKAAREARVHTSWTDPNAEFEDALAAFIAALLPDDAAGSRFLAEVAAVALRIARPGLWNALARTLVHLTAPGVPDLYQGDELWNFALVDPDNRRPVDFAARQAALTALEGAADATAVRELLAWPEDGRVKLHLVRAALRARRERPDLFATGSYEPLEAEGPAAAHVLAFARRTEEAAAVIVAPRLAASIGRDTAPPVGSEVWAGTRLRLPRPLDGVTLTDAVTGETRQVVGEALDLAHVLAVFPGALLVTEAPLTARRAPSADHVASVSS